MKKESLITVSVLMLSVAQMLFVIIARPQLHAIAQQSSSSKDSSQSNRPKVVEGTWQGTLETGGAKLRLAFEITKSPDGTLTGNLDSLDQGAMDIPINSIVLKDTNLRLEIKIIGGVYEGTLDEEGTTIVGHWEQGGVKLPLTFRRSSGALSAPNRPQEPKKPYPFDEQEVSYENKKAGVRLDGTLTLPRTRGLHPAVLLINGSGAQDRNETVAGHRPFLVLADHLTRRGIAVLRVDDRGLKGSQDDFYKATDEDFASDVLAGVEFLKTRKEINPKQIGLIGHSEGGVIAPMAAVESNDVAFIVLMAAPALPGDQFLHLQTASLMKASGASDENISQVRALQERMFTILKQEKTDTKAGERLRAEVSGMLARMTDEQKLALGLTEAAMENQFKVMMTRWYRYIIAYDPRPALMKVKVPVLAINGKRDLQVPAKENLSAIAQALRAGGNKDHTVVELPGLNHLFQTSQSGLPAEYAQIEETMSPAALQMIVDWVLKRTPKR
ncbi:MAG TPA: alpha/beta hydrolase [Pyrinomonadaceae bacterium]|nr:alpha/beta hydrolase [Pyrinomonadaceae bacterium]